MKTNLPVVCAIAALFFVGCGDDGFKPQDPYRELTSPENVVYNFALSFEKRDYDELSQLLHADFTFVFDDADLWIAGVPDSGVWARGAFLSAAGKVMDFTHVPCDSSMMLKEISMDLELFGEPVAMDHEEAPSGTVRDYVNLLANFQTVDEVLFLVDSRPKFFFAADSTRSPVLWKLWRIEDDHLDSLTGAAAGFNSVEDGAQHDGTFSAESVFGGPTDEGLLGLGPLLALFSRSCE